VALGGQRAARARHPSQGVGIYHRARGRHGTQRAWDRHRVAMGEGYTLHIEVKGYPLATRRTRPNVQAPQLYAQAMYTAMRLYDEHAFDMNDRRALAFPDVDVYTRLIHRTDRALARLRVGVFLIGHSGNVWAMRDY